MLSLRTVYLFNKDKIEHKFLSYLKILILFLFHLFVGRKTIKKHAEIIYCSKNIKFSQMK